MSPIPSCFHMFDEKKRLFFIRTLLLITHRRMLDLFQSCVSKHKPIICVSKGKRGTQTCIFLCMFIFFTCPVNVLLNELCVYTVRREEGGGGGGVSGLFHNAFFSPFSHVKAPYLTTSSTEGPRQKQANWVYISTELKHCCCKRPLH